MRTHLEIIGYRGMTLGATCEACYGAGLVQECYKIDRVFSVEHDRLLFNYKMDRLATIQHTTNNVSVTLNNILITWA